ncbi:hypothetical protein [Klebsiella pneumoniae]
MAVSSQAGLREQRHGEHVVDGVSASVAFSARRLTSQRGQPA